MVAWQPAIPSCSTVRVCIGWSKSSAGAVTASSVPRCATTRSSWPNSTVPTTCRADGASTWRRAPISYAAATIRPRSAIRRDRSPGSSSCTRRARNCGRAGPTASIRPTNPSPSTPSSACTAATWRPSASSTASCPAARIRTVRTSGGADRPSSSRSTAPNRAGCVSAPRWTPARPAPPAMTWCSPSGSTPTTRPTSSRPEVSRAPRFWLRCRTAAPRPPRPRPPPTRSAPPRTRWDAGCPTAICATCSSPRGSRRTGQRWPAAA